MTFDMTQSNALTELNTEQLSLQSGPSHGQTTDCSSEERKWDCTSSPKKLANRLIPLAKKSDIGGGEVFEWDYKTGKIENKCTGISISIEGADKAEVSKATAQSIQTIALAVTRGLQTLGYHLKSAEERPLFNAAIKTVRATWLTWGNLTVDEISQELPQDGEAFAEEILGLLGENGTRPDVRVFGGDWYFNDDRHTRPRMAEVTSQGEDMDIDRDE